MMHKKYSLRQRMIMAIRSIPVRELAECAVNCVSCGSSNVSGSGPWTCNSCGLMWQ